MLDRILRLPRLAVFLGALALVLLGLLLPGVAGAAVLLVIVAGMAWLLTRTWPAHRVPDRVLRLAVLALFVGVAVAKIV